MLRNLALQSERTYRGEMRKRSLIPITILFLVAGIFPLIISPGSVLAQKQQGTLSGKVRIGPLCPHEPCPNPTPDIYSSRELILHSKVGEPIHVKLNPDGTFRAIVNAGTYRVDLTNCVFLGCKFALPQTVTIKPGQTTTLTIKIDTGIR